MHANTTLLKEIRPKLEIEELSEVYQINKYSQINSDT